MWLYAWTWPLGKSRSHMCFHTLLTKISYKNLQLLSLLHLPTKHQDLEWAWNPGVQYGKGSIKSAPGWLTLSLPAAARPHASELHRSKTSASTVLSHQDLMVCLWGQVMFPLNITDFHKNNFNTEQRTDSNARSGHYLKNVYLEFSVVEA